MEHNGNIIIMDQIRAGRVPVVGLECVDCTRSHDQPPTTCVIWVHVSIVSVSVEMCDRLYHTNYSDQ